MRLRTPGRNGYASTSMMRRQPARTGRPSDAHARALADTGIERLRHLDLLVGGPHPHRGIRHHLAILDDGRGVGQHPVVATVLAAVLDQPQPGLARLQGAPQISWPAAACPVTDDVMRLADQLFAGEAADLDEGGIGIENPAFGVRARDEVLILAQLGFHIVDGRFTRTASLLLLHTEKSDSMTAARRAARCAGLSPSGP